MMKAVLLATLCILAVLSSINQVLPQETRPEMVFVQGEEKYPARVEQDRFAVILAEKVASDEGSRRVTMESLKAAPIAGLPDNIISVPVEGTNEAKALTEIARRLRSGRGSEIAASGVIAFIGTSNSPFVITDEIIIQVESDGKIVEDIAARFGAKIAAANPYDKNQFVIELPPGSKEATLDVSNAINAIPGVRFAHPNFYQAIEFRQARFIPDDPFFADQWHLDNTGQNGGTADADIDADLAWSFTQGSNSIVIAIIDQAFDIGHPDLQPNLLINAGEIAGDGLDNDGNDRIDDVNGWNFTGCTHATMTNCGNADVTPIGREDHGTVVAGAAVARGNNMTGVSGVCPQCRFLPIKISRTNNYAEGLAIGYAQARGADIISNSWAYLPGDVIPLSVKTAIDTAAIHGRGGLGAVVVFAMTNLPPADNCIGSTPDISSLENVIAVSRSTNQDRFSSGGYGDCMDVLGPTKRGTLAAVSTDRRGISGYNTVSAADISTSAFPCPLGDFAAPPASNLDYTRCFGGSSFSAPVVAGEAGLLLSLDNTLARLEVQRIIQDTADKVEDSVGAYSESTGFSAPPGGAAPTHGFGRVNAFEAVRLIASAAGGGHGGTDIFIRDNRLDWGNTEKPSSYTFEQTPGFIPHWQSVDIKIDAPPYRTTPPVTAAEFDGFAHENPLSNTLNKVYVRVHNRGPRAATNVQIKLNWAFAGAGLPALPSDFWIAFPGNASAPSGWNPIGTIAMPANSALAYSGASVAGTAADSSFIATFDFNAPVFDPALQDPEHYCLFAVISSDEDPVSADSMMSLVPDDITPRDNNVTHRNVQLIDSGGSDRIDMRLMVSNPFDEAIETRLSARIPKGWKIAVDGAPWDNHFFLESGKSLPIDITLLPGKGKFSGIIDVLQHYRRKNMKDETVLGGTSLHPAARKILLPRSKELLLMTLVEKHQLLIENYQAMIYQLLQNRRNMPDGEQAALNQLGEILAAQGNLLSVLAESQ